MGSAFKQRILGSISKVTGQAPTGTVNGSNTSFTTSSNFIAGSLEVYKNGVRLKSGAGNDYTENGTNGFIMATAPATGTQLLVDYQTAATNSGNADTLDGKDSSYYLPVTIYNTADEVTNYERVKHSWVSNIYTIASEWAGTGTPRAINLFTNGGAASTANFQIYRGGAPFFTMAHSITALAGAVGANIIGSTNSSSSTYTALSITPTVNQSSTAGYSGLVINVTETATGSGTKLLLDTQVGGTSRFSVSNTGTVTMSTSSGDVLILNGTGTTNALMRFKDDGTETAAIFTLNGATTLNLRSQSNVALVSDNATTSKQLLWGGSALTFPDATNIAFNATTGTKIGTATTQKLSFYNATPIVQPSATPANATDLATAITLVNNLKSKLISLGLIA